MEPEGINRRKEKGESHQPGEKDVWKIDKSDKTHEREEMRQDTLEIER